MSTLVLKLIAALAAILYASAFVLSIKKRHSGRMLAIIWGLGYAANFALVLNNYLVNGYVPFVSMYQVLTFLGICFLPIYAYMRIFRGGRWMAPAFLAVPAVIMIGLLFMDANSKWTFPPALQSPWFVPHVLVYMIAYTMGAVSFVFALGSVIMRGRSSAAKLSQGVYDSVCVVFPFMTMGMFFGAIWANEVWGHFWSWDIKELWSLITWLTYAVYLHFHRDVRLKKFEQIPALLGFVGIVITFFFVNIISSGVHSYSA